MRGHCWRIKQAKPREAWLEGFHNLLAVELRPQHQPFRGLLLLRPRLHCLSSSDGDGKDDACNNDRKDRRNILRILRIRHIRIYYTGTSQCHKSCSL